jgi:hypothetical protein
MIINRIIKTYLGLTIGLFLAALIIFFIYENPYYYDKCLEHEDGFKYNIYYYQTLFYPAAEVKMSNLYTLWQSMTPSMI